MFSVIEPSSHILYEQICLKSKWRCWCQQIWSPHPLQGEKRVLWREKPTLPREFLLIVSLGLIKSPQHPPSPEDGHLRILGSHQSFSGLFKTQPLSIDQLLFWVLIRSGAVCTSELENANRTCNSPLELWPNALAKATWGKSSLWSHLKVQSIMAWKARWGCSVTWHPQFVFSMLSPLTQCGTQAPGMMSETCSGYLCHNYPNVDNPSQISPEICLLNEPKSCGVDNQH